MMTIARQTNRSRDHQGSFPAYAVYTRYLYCIGLLLVALYGMGCPERHRSEVAATGQDLTDLGPDTRSAGSSDHPPFSLQRTDSLWWLVSPEGKPFFSLGVCVVTRGLSKEDLDPGGPLPVVLLS